MKKTIEEHASGLDGAMTTLSQALFNHIHQDCGSLYDETYSALDDGLKSSYRDLIKAAIGVNVAWRAKKRIESSTNQQASCDTVRVS